MFRYTLPWISFSETELAAARQELTEFVERMAKQAAERVGFGWIPTADAPNSWHALLEAWEHSRETGTPLPISNVGCHDVIFTSPEAIGAYRFWHDVTHVERERDFTNPHEVDIAIDHLDEAERNGLKPDSLAWRLLHADAIGTVMSSSVNRSYLINQRVFILNYVQFGLGASLLAELARAGQYDPARLRAGVDYTTDAVAPIPSSKAGDHHE
ncbi:hypothetical protein [Subtercola frigoramans]|uniref:Uncharacterized protein n=1 Tax=Subtercola frigoramans TaxID=120298 RepID=A0ABS2L5W6_9MICO|nr:hypothetical protein [Subtercola frigoramans]MBM7472497.1 hypothetical protein [Subtercola frigoramans]